MSTQCTPEQLEFHALGRRTVSGRFDGGRLSSDGGGLLLREADVRIGLLSRLAQCFVDHRQSGSVEHELCTLVSQRVYALALGYEDLNDHDALRTDSVLALLSGVRDVPGAKRVRARDRGNPLAGSSTLNRLELGGDDAASDRYKKIAADSEAMDRLLVDVFLESYTEAPREIWLDLDATDDPLHGHQEGRFFHGYYGHYCYLPLYIFCGEHLLCARLRRSNMDGAGRQRGGTTADRHTDPHTVAKHPDHPARGLGLLPGALDALLRGRGTVVCLWSGTQCPARAGTRREAARSQGSPSAHRPPGTAVPRLQLPHAKRAGHAHGGLSARRSIWTKARTRASSSRICRSEKPVPDGCTKNSIVSAATWRTGLRSSSWDCSPIAPVRQPCGRISCDCTSPRSPMC